MGLQPTASKTALLLACPRPFDPDVEIEPELPGESAQYGSAFHQVAAACLKGPKQKLLETTARYAKEVDLAAKRYGVADREELARHVRGGLKVLRAWLARERLIVFKVEQAYAIRPRGGLWVTRYIEPHDENHRYDVRPGEIPGTVDLVAVAAGRAVIIDHKTGGGDEERFAQPSTIPQMRTLGLGLAEKPHWHTELGIFHADRRGLPIVYSEAYEDSEAAKHSQALGDALELVGKGLLRPGPYCKRCPARTTCPAQAADLLSNGTAALVKSANALAAEPIDPKKFGILADPQNGLSVEDRAGALYELLKRFRALDKAGVEEIKRLVRGGAVIETHDGKVLAIQTQNYETLSKKSVVDALGKFAGEKMLASLRKKGAIREATRELLVGEK